MQLKDIVASRQYSFIYEADSATVAKSTNKGGRAGVAPNPYYGRVSSRKVYAGQAATAEMLLKAQLALDPTYQPDPTYSARHQAVPDFPCVVQSLTNGQYQVRIMRPRTVKVEWFVDSRPATSAELAIIKQYKRARSSDPKRVKVMFPYVDNLANVEGDLPEVEDED